jgi:hypothetical protein
LDIALASVDLNAAEVYEAPLIVATLDDCEFRASLIKSGIE